MIASFGGKGTPAPKQPQPAPAAPRRRTPKQVEPVFIMAPILASPRDMRAEMDVIFDDAGDESDSGLFRIVALRGFRADGKAHLSAIDIRKEGARKTRSVLVEHIHHLLPAGVDDAPDDVERWLRLAGGLGWPDDLAWKAEQDAIAAAEAAEDAAWEAHLARLAQRIGGEETLVAPTRIRLRSRRNGADADITTLVLGFDTDEAGQPSLLFVAKSASAKRGRLIYLAEALESGEETLVALHAPPDGPEVSDIPAWLAGLPRREAHD
ncbi:hypothetical protein ACVFYP_22370 [Roseomonas sp. F4]